MSDERGVEERLAKLEERLSRLEQRLTGVAAPVQPTAPPPPPMPAAPPVRPPPLPPMRVVTRPEPPPLPPVFGYDADAPTLETQVGLKWAGWVGAIIVVIGAALGIKYAYDQNWFGALSPATRLALMSLGGFALIGAGEIVYRRVGMVASAGLFGAGVATLFVVSYAGYGYFALYDREVAYALMAACTLVGAAVAMRGNLVSIAILSIVGGNVAPIALQGDEARVTALLSYVLAMQVVALVLAWWGRGPKWWTLRGVAFATICLWMAVPVLDSPSLLPSDRRTALAFAVIYAILFHSELILSSLRKPLPTTTRDPGFTVPVPLGRREDLVAREGLGVTFSLFVTAALTFAVLVILRDRSEMLRGAWVIGLAACCLALGLVLPNLAREQASSWLSPARALAVAYRIQAAALVVVSVPVTLSGMWITVAWLTLALALAVAGARFDLGVSRAAAMGVWILAAGYLVVWSVGTAAAAITWAWLLGQPIPAYFVLASLVAVAGHLAAALMRENWSGTAVRVRPADDRETADADQGDVDGPHDLHYESRADTAAAAPRAPDTFQALASVADVMAAVVFAVAAAAALPRVGFTFAVVCYAWVMIGVGQIVRSPTLHPVGLLMLLAAALKWMLWDTLEPRINDVGRGGGGPAGQGYPPVYNPAVAVGAALFVSGLALRWVPLRIPRVLWSEVARAASERSIRAAAGFVAVLVALWAVTMEVDRYYEMRIAAAVAAADARDFELAKQVAISILWSLYAVGCVAAGFAVRVAGLRYFGLALFALTVGKVMLVDLRGVGQGYRTLSFLGLGLLLLGTSVLYGKLSPRLLGQGDNVEQDKSESLNTGGPADDKVVEAP